MAVDLLLGLQWGDEGKGKIVDVLTKDYDIIARFQGGPNAGTHSSPDGRRRRDVLEGLSLWRRHHRLDRRERLAGPHR